MVWVPKQRVGYIDWGNPLARKLVGHWRMSEGGGSILKDYVKHQDFSANGLYFQSGGPRGPVLNFTASFQKVTCTTLSTPVAPFSIVALLSSTSATDQRPIGFSDAGGHYVGIGLTALKVYLFGNDGPNFIAPNSGVAATSGVPVHAAVVVPDTSHQLIYQDGILRNSNAAALNVPAMGGGTFGGFQDITFTGKIDHVFLYARAISAEEIQALRADPDQILYKPRVSVMVQVITPVTGIGSFTFGAMTVSGAGSVVNPVTGSGAFTFGAMTVAGTGTVVNPVTGVGSFTFDPLTVTGAGDVVNPVTGVGSFTFDPMTVTGTGDVVEPVTGAGSFTFDPLTVTGTGTVINPVTGEGSFTFDPLTVTGTGTVINPVTGIGSFTFDPLTVSGTGTVVDPVIGTASFTFDPLTVTGAGTVINPVTGIGSFTFAPMTVRGAGTVTAPVSGCRLPSACAPAPSAGRAKPINIDGAGRGRCTLALPGAGNAHYRWRFTPACRQNGSHRRIRGAISTAENFMLALASGLGFRGLLFSSTSEAFSTAASGNQGFRGSALTSETESLDVTATTSPFITYSDCKDEIILTFGGAPTGTLYIVQVAEDSEGPWVDHILGIGDSAGNSVTLNNDYAGAIWFRVQVATFEAPNIIRGAVLRGPEKPDAALVEPPVITVGHMSGFTPFQPLWESSNDGFSYPFAYNRTVNARINKGTTYIVPRSRIRWSSGPQPRPDSTANLISVTGASGAVHKWTRDGTDPNEGTVDHHLDGIANNAAVYRSDFGYVVKARSFVGGCRSPVTTVLVDKQVYETHNNVALGEGNGVAATCDFARTDNIRTDWSRDLVTGEFLFTLTPHEFRSGNDCEDLYAPLGVREWVIKTARDIATGANSRTFSFRRGVTETIGGTIADYGTGDEGDHRSGFLWDKADCSSFGAIGQSIGGVVGLVALQWTRAAIWDLFPVCYTNAIVGWAGGGVAGFYCVNNGGAELTGPGGSTLALQRLVSQATIDIVKPLYEGNTEGVLYYDVYAYLTLQNDNFPPFNVDYVAPAVPPDPNPFIGVTNGDDFETYLDYADATVATLNEGDGWTGAWAISNITAGRGHEDFESYDDADLDDGLSALGFGDGWSGPWTFRTSVGVIGQESFETYTDVRGMTDGTYWNGPWETRFSYFGAIGSDNFEFYADANPILPDSLDAGELYRLPWVITDIGFFGRETFESYSTGNVTSTENAGPDWGSTWKFSDIGFFGRESFETYPDGVVTNTENDGDQWGSAWAFSNH